LRAPLHLQISQNWPISAGTVHVRVKKKKKKMEDAGIILGSSLTLDYEKWVILSLHMLGCS
jgi:hypothetical protein